MMKIGFIGTGNMGGALASAAARSGEVEVLLANRTKSKAEALAERIGAVVSSNEIIAREADHIFLGVKPQMIVDVLKDIAPALKERKSAPVLISMVTGPDIARIQELAGGDYPVIRIEYADDRAQQLEQTLKKQEKAAREAAQALSDRRHAAAKELEERISRELRELDMPKLRFAIDFQEKDMGEDGVDAVAFLMSANVGEALRPIQKIASGGELSRIMLALKNVLAEQDSVMTMVFDEVDTGVSGRAAQRVAEKLAKLSRARQVLCVTHLPQLAAMADTHFGVEKGEENGRTLTKVVALDRAARRGEIARLSGGDHPSETMLLGAEELLCAAENFKNQLL